MAVSAPHAATLKALEVATSVGFSSLVTSDSLCRAGEAPQQHRTHSPRAQSVSSLGSNRSESEVGRYSYGASCSASSLGPRTLGTGSRADVLGAVRASLQRLRRRAQDMSRIAVKEESFEAVRNCTQEMLSALERSVNLLTPEVAESVEEMRKLQLQSLDREVAESLKTCLASQEAHSREVLALLKGASTESHVQCASEVRKDEPSSGTRSLKGLETLNHRGNFEISIQAQGFLARRKTLEDLIRKEKDRTYQLHGFVMRHFRELLHEQFARVDAEAELMRSQSERHCNNILDRLPEVGDVEDPEQSFSGLSRQKQRDELGPLAKDVDRLRERVDAFEKAGKPTEGPTREAVLMQLGALMNQIGLAASLGVPGAPPGPVGGPSTLHSQASHGVRAGTEVTAEVTASGQDSDVRFCVIPEHCPSAPPSRTQSSPRSSPLRRDAPSCATSERRTSRVGSSRQSCATTPCISNSGSRSDTPVRDNVTVRRARSVGGVAIPVRHTKASQLRKAALQSRTASPGCSPSVSPRQSPERTQSPPRPQCRKGATATAEIPSTESRDMTVSNSGFLEDSVLDTSLRSELEAMAGSPASPTSSVELASSDGPRAGEAPVTKLEPRCIRSAVSLPACDLRSRSGEGALPEDVGASGSPQPRQSTSLGSLAGLGSSPGSPPLLSARLQHSWSQPPQVGLRVPGAPPPVSPAQLPRLVMPQPRGSSLGAPVSAPSPWPIVMRSPPYSGVYTLR